MSLDEIRKAAGLGPLRCAECRAFGGPPDEVLCAHDGALKCSKWRGGPVDTLPKDAARADASVESRHREAHAMVARYHGTDHETDARFLLALLGPDPADRATRLHAHGALLERAAQAAYRLARHQLEKLSDI